MAKRNLKNNLIWRKNVSNLHIVCSRKVYTHDRNCIFSSTYNYKFYLSISERDLKYFSSFMKSYTYMYKYFNGKITNWPENNLIFIIPLQVYINSKANIQLGTILVNKPFINCFYMIPIFFLKSCLMK